MRHFLIFLASVFFLLSCGTKSSVSITYPRAEHLQAKVDGFSVETVMKGTGDWLSLTKDPFGRLLVSPRKGNLMRFDVSGGPQALKVDTLDLGVYDCQGLLCAYGYLYMMGQTADTVRGIYRLKDLDGKGTYGSPVLMKEFEKNGDHSGHTLTVGPDGKIYFLTGNSNFPPLDSSVSYVHKIWTTDHLNPLPLLYGRDQLPPGGFVMRFDSLGTAWEFYSYGLRNPYDMCFSPEGELFTFDSDMEWDFNLPWYRPTRINHLVSGGDYAWRPGVAKRFDYYPDIWPSVVDFWRGSPTSTCFGTLTDFPPKYRDALFVGDWSYGKIYAVHLKPDGSSYKADYETFITGQPLNITDMVAGDDGALYFTTGGNGTDNGLFRISYDGHSSGLGEEKNFDSQASELRNFRHQIEAFHFSQDTSGLGLALRNIGHTDRFIRNACRVILERNEPSSWISALAEAPSTEAHMTLLTALIRSDTAERYKELIFKAFDDIDYLESSLEGKLGLLRLYGLTFLRSKKIPVHFAQSVYDKLMIHYPAGDSLLDKELSRLLGYLTTWQKDPQPYLAKTFQLLENTQDPLQFIHYLEVMRSVPRGWTIEQRLAYRHWIEYARQNFNGGSLFRYFLTVMEQDFDKTISVKEKRLMDRGTPGPLTAGYEGPVKPRAKANWTSTFDRQYLNDWQFEDLQYNLELVQSPRSRYSRDFNRGQKMFAKGQCYNCHYMIDKGGNFGPDLTTAGNSFAVEELLRTILYPSEVINSRFQATEYKMNDGTVKIGRPVAEDRKSFTLQIGHDPANQITILKNDVTSSGPAKVSEMMPGLLNTMSRSEVMDLLYFIIRVAGKNKDSLEMNIFDERELFVKGDSTLIEMYNYADRGSIHYTLDGTDPDENSMIYEQPFYLKSSTQIKAKVIDGQATSGTVTSGKIVERSVHAVDTSVNGMRWKFYKNIEEPFNLKKLRNPDASGVSYVFEVNDIVDEENNIMVTHDGFLKIDRAGTYTFYTRQDDKCQLFIDGQLVVDASKNRQPSVVSGQINLEAGLHQFSAPFFDMFADEYMNIEIEGPGISRRTIPADWIFRENSSL